MAPRLIARPIRFTPARWGAPGPQGRRRSIATWRETPKSLEHQCSKDHCHSSRVKGAAARVAPTGFVPTGANLRIGATATQMSGDGSRRRTLCPRRRWPARPRRGRAPERTHSNVRERGAQPATKDWTSRLRRAGGV